MGKLDSYVNSNEIRTFPHTTLKKKNKSSLTKILNLRSKIIKLLEKNKQNTLT